MSEHDKILCIYHGHCADGFSAAWVVRRYFGENRVEFVAAVHGEDAPEVSNRHVVMVDFSYKRPVIDEFAQRCASLLILDHHKSAKLELAGFREPDQCWPFHLDRAAEATENSDKVAVLFDMERSGAVMAWDYFFRGEDAPDMLLHVQDRDLWQFKMHDTRDLSALFFSYPYEFQIWDKLVMDCANPVQRAKLAAIGHALNRKHQKDIAELLPQVTRPMRIGGHVVPVGNLPYTMASEAAGELAKDRPFAACYFDGPNGRNFSLRSTKHGLDVSKIAASYGGGGHEHAAGFRRPLGWEGDA